MRWKRVMFLFVLVAALCGGTWFFFTRMEREAPVINFAEELRYIGKKTEWTFTATDGKKAVRRDLCHRFFVVGVVVEFCALGRVFLLLLHAHLSVRQVGAAKALAQFGVFGDPFGNDVSRAG